MLLLVMELLLRLLLRLWLLGKSLTVRAVRVESRSHGGVAGWAGRAVRNMSACAD